MMAWESGGVEPSTQPAASAQVSQDGTPGNDTPRQCFPQGYESGVQEPQHPAATMHEKPAWVNLLLPKNRGGSSHY